eukprot:TRINITY_DN4251_c0_g1_i3.p1 TRINITY_DN4251_c0_g1~~TRINITY_DN4251_c0_g1_i3.p1  ORF type:complete len:105 (+),score=1.41 TRINITY_DN4251_c0_g1_i3:164-478(+)
MFYFLWRYKCGKKDKPEEVIVRVRRIPVSQELFQTISASSLPIQQVEDNTVNVGESSFVQAGHGNNAVRGGAQVSHHKDHRYLMGSGLSYTYIQNNDAILSEGQ